MSGFSRTCVEADLQVRLFCRGGRLKPARGLSTARACRSATPPPQAGKSRSARYPSAPRRLSA